MKRFLKPVGKGLLCVLLVALSLKGIQTVCWRNNVSLISPPSLGSWDPTERVEAAWQAAKKYGGQQ